MEKPEDTVQESRNVYGDQDAFGNDLSILRMNLKLTPEQRLLKAQVQIRALIKLIDAARPTR